MSIRLKIANQDDRLSVAAILVKNGYGARQIKVKRSETARTVDTYLEISERLESSDTSKAGGA